MNQKNGSEEEGLGRGIGFVGVHIGAGQHSQSKTPFYLALCSKACQEAIRILNEGGNALEAATQGTMVLEDAGETNAGYGSNLTECGNIEMDAGVMDGSDLMFGAVGAIPGIKNPVLVAKLLIQEQKKGLLPLGRVPPLFMVGEGARNWAIRHGVPAVPQESLISDKASKLYKYYKDKLDKFMMAYGKKKPQTEVIENSANKKQKIDIDDRVTDTVGVVVMDKNGNIASSVSSGGIALKQKGRVGQASCFGSGCWAQNASSSSNFGIGVSTTGCGEHLVKTLLAREIANALRGSNTPLFALKDMMSQHFVESEFLTQVAEKSGGAICLHYNRYSEQAEFLWTHTTASLGLGFQTTNCEKPTVKMSRLPDNISERRGTTILIESVPLVGYGSKIKTAEQYGSRRDETMPVEPDVQEIVVESAKA